MVREALEAIKPGARPGIVAATLLVLALTDALHAQSAIKLATVVPQGSVWDKNLKQMGEEWSQATGGRVAVTVFSGGSQGDEPTVVRKMRLDAIQAGAFTNLGLGNIDWAFNVFDIPFFFDSYDELNYVTDKLTPVLRKRIEPKGFMLLNWGHGGWTQVFTKSRCRRSTTSSTSSSGRRPATTGWCSGSRRTASSRARWP